MSSSYKYTGRLECTSSVPIYQTKLSMMADLHCNGLRRVIKIILSAHCSTYIYANSICVSNDYVAKSSWINAYALIYCIILACHMHRVRHPRWQSDSITLTVQDSNALLLLTIFCPVCRQFWLVDIDVESRICLYILCDMQIMVT
jgi:hypothetical protein